MNTTHLSPPSPPMSPWLDANLTNEFRHEIELACENSADPGLIPHPAFKWVCMNAAEQLLYTGLAKFAPLLPTIGFEKEVSLWTAPPPFGSGNAVFIIMGKDKEGAVRLFGGNYFISPRAEFSEPISSAELFLRLHSLDSDREKMSLVTEVMSSSISLEDRDWVIEVGSQCSTFYTMPIYLLVLDGKQKLLAGGPAVVEGLKQTEFSLECFGEVTL